MARAWFGFLCIVAAISACRGICPPCACSGHEVSCMHMSMYMTGIPPGIPASTRSLDLGNHHIKRINKDRLSHLTDLETLILAGNKISSVAATTFSSLTQLQTLDLYGNQISTLNKDSFHGLHALQHLNLSHNDLSYVSLGTFSSLNELVSLNLAGNPLHCNCSIAWTLTFAPIHADLIPPLTCTTPNNLKDRQVDGLSMMELGCVVPTVTPVVAEVAAYDGKGVLLSCSVVGVSVSELTWEFNEEMVTGADQNVQLLVNGSLEIVAMRADLAGEYVCVASNMAGTGRATVTLRYLGVVMPHIITPPSHTHAFTGENVTLYCTGDMYAESYYWLHTGTPVVASSHITIEMGQGLHITNVTTSDSGRYTCVAESTQGSVQASAFLNVTGPLLSCQGIIDASTVDAIRSVVNFAFNRSSRRNVTSPHQLLRHLKLPDNGSIDLLVAGDVFLEAIAMVRASHRGDSEGGVPALSECEVNLLAQLAGCLESDTTAPDCSDTCLHRRYRSVDGSCNNWAHPRWGMTDSSFQRLLPPAYEDGLGLPVGWSGGLPSARAISQSVIRTHEIESDEDTTHMLMQIGQFLDHDIDLAPGTPSDVAFSSGAMCDVQCANSAPCFPIPVPDNDPRLSGECLPFTRSGGVCGTGPSSLLVGTQPYHREQLNIITSFMDASQIYGSTAKHAQRLRDPARPGWLLEGMAGPGGKPFLPFDKYSLIECSTGIHSNRSACFLAGDVRANEQVALTAMHTLFFREHNRIVSFLHDLNPHWDQETLFQETRKIVIAEWQHIIFSEYLPKILGPSGMAIMGDYRGYDPSVNPTIVNVFATAAFRFGHSQILPVFQRLDKDYQPRPEGHLLLRNAFFAPFRLLEEGGIDPMLRGLVASAGKKRSPISGLNTNLTEALFAQANEVALDLAALNIQRGRDHGLPSYVKWREFCGLQTQDPLADINNTNVRQKLMDVYGDVEDIGVWVGGLLESVKPGAQLGPTFNCIIADQFRRLREGDRFWYQRSGQFTPDQLLQLEMSSLSRVICDNGDDISRVPRDAFKFQSVSEFSECSELPTVNLSLWGDCPDAVSDRERRSVLMSSVAEEVQQLKEAVASLQNNAVSCVMNGVKYSHSEEWNMDQCRRCSCQMGAITCKSLPC